MLEGNAVGKTYNLLKVLFHRLKKKNQTEKIKDSVSLMQDVGTVQIHRFHEAALRSAGRRCLQIAEQVKTS